MSALRQYVMAVTSRINKCNFYKAEINYDPGGNALVLSTPKNRS